jgi:hypothetical protein
VYNAGSGGNLSDAVIKYTFGCKEIADKIGSGF